MLKVFLIFFILSSCASKEEQLNGIYTKSKALAPSQKENRSFLAVFNNLSLLKSEKSIKILLRYIDILKINYKENIVFINNGNDLPASLKIIFDFNLMNEVLYSNMLNDSSFKGIYLSSNSHSIKNEAPVKNITQYKKVETKNKNIIFYSLDQLPYKYASNNNILNDLYLRDPIYSLNNLQRKNKILKKEASIIFVNGEWKKSNDEFTKNRISLSKKRLVFSDTKIQRSGVYFLPQDIDFSFSIIEVEVNGLNEIKLIQKEDIKLCSFFWKKTLDCVDRKNNKFRAKAPAYFLGEKI